MGSDPFERPKDRLNEATPDAMRCFWPGCGRALQVTIKGTLVQDRYGILCSKHAVDVTQAVIQDEVDLARFKSIMTDARARRMELIEADRHLGERMEAELAELRQDCEGFVYYIQVDERIKIGYSVDVRRRMRSYPPASKLLAVEPGDRTVERDRHRQFAGSLAYGREWFTPTMDIREHIDQLLATHGPPPRHMAHHYTAKRQPMRIRPAS